jgi:hypothetical protein
MSGSTVRFFPPPDQGMFLLSILRLIPLSRVFGKTDRNWIKKEQDPIAKKLALSERAGDRSASRVLSSL